MLVNGASLFSKGQDKSSIVTLFPCRLCLAVSSVWTKLLMIVDSLMSKTKAGRADLHDSSQSARRAPLGRTTVASEEKNVGEGDQPILRCTIDVLEKYSQ